MAFLEGKTATEKKQIIAAGVLGLVALVALYMAFGRSFFGGSSSSASTKSTPTPRPTASSTGGDTTALPTESQKDFVYQSTAIDYQSGDVWAPDPGRNIFAFYEPAPPCKGADCPPPPTPKPVEVKTPPPAPTPVQMIASLSTQSVYAGSKGFRLEVNGDHFTPDTQIYFNQAPMPTTYINGQKLVTDIPANLISQEGGRQVITQTPDGKTYSNQYMMNVQAPPRPTVKYIGMIGRKRYNNDTAYFTDNDKGNPFGARLNDVVNNRFRLISITPSEVTFQDVDLGFKHRVAISKDTSGGTPGINPGGKPGDNGFASPFDPGSIPSSIAPGGDIPGIPGNVQRFSPNQVQSQPAMESAPQKKPIEKKDVDDAGDD